MPRPFICRSINVACLRRSLPVLLGCLLLALPGWRASGPAQERGQAQVSFESLLDEMVDRAAVARWPDPEYRTLQASSWDRRASSNASQGHNASSEPNTAPTDEAWFANGDFGQYLRIEQRDGRTERVMMDVQGPGAIVRIWSANPDIGGTLRIYLDGSDEPVLEENFKKLTDGTGPIAAPLSAARSRGHNLYLPIPYAKGCKVTLDADPEHRLYYIINYRSYQDGAQVRSFSRQDLAAHGELLKNVQAILQMPEPPAGDRDDAGAGESGNLERGEQLNLKLTGGPAAVQEFTVTVKTQRPEQMEAALRSLVLEGQADGERTIRAPLGDFFGSGVGLNPYEGWYRSVSADGRMSCRWVMPYRESIGFTITNHGETSAEVEMSASSGVWDWDDRSMYFRANFRQQRNIPTRPRQDFNYLTVEGQGVYVGDTLAVANPTPAWWGEGDEKVYVDGEKFPSHFGTGTEDYYGYAWCWPDLFKAPFHAQPRCDGPDNFGHTTNTRVRSLDAIPFEERFQFDMEVWHWQEVQVSYASTAYWYGRPGAKAVGPAASDELDLHVPELPPMHRLEDVIEGEALKVLGQSDEFPVGRQMLFGSFEGNWSEGRHLWIRASEAGQWVDLELPTPARGEKKLTAWLTKAPDYGIVQFHVNGKPIGEPVDLYSTKVEPMAPVEIGIFTADAPQATLRLEVVGSNEKAKGARTFSGLDAVRITPIR